MNRRQQLIDLIGEDSIDLVSQVVDEVIYLEDQLKELKKLPAISVNPSNKALQKVTPAGKLYKEYLQQYINCIKAIEYIVYKDKRLDGDEPEESPLRAWAKLRKDSGDYVNK